MTPQQQTEAEKAPLIKLIEKIEKKLNEFPDDDNLSLSARGLQDGYINCLQWALELFEH